MQSHVMLIVVAIMAIVAIAIYGYYMAARRRKELSAWAFSKGLDFDQSRDSMLDDRFAQFDCLRQGHSRYAHNRTFGDWNGREFLGFDYHYQTGSGKNRRTHRFSGVVLKSDVPLKPLYIRSERFFDKVTEFFGLDDIDFESAEFSRKFYVKSADKRWAYDVIHQRTMAFLLSAPRFSIKFDLMHVIAWRDKRLSPGEFEDAAGVICGILERLPEYVLRQQTGRG